MCAIQVRRITFFCHTDYHFYFILQLKEQYKFVYLAVLEALLSGDTRIPACYFAATLVKLKEGPRTIKGKRTQISTQFEVL